MVKTMQLTVDNLAHWSGGRWYQKPDVEGIRGVSQDTRKIVPGMLYVALIGERFDGHDYIEEALKKGAVAALVSDSYQGEESGLLLVQDPLKALHKIAVAYRQLWSGCAIGITGSVGKTTVKELCSVMISDADDVHKTPGNYNNHIGVPLTLLELQEKHRWAVLELGMNHPGEIKPLAEMIEPEIGIITDLGAAHRAHFNSMEEIVFEKADLVRVLPKNGTAILMRNEVWYDTLSSQTDATILDVGLDVDATIRGSFQGDVLVVDGYHYQLPQPGEHMARNVLRAIGLGLLFGRTHDQMMEGLKAYTPAPMRWAEHELEGVSWINDAYNANPLSMRASLQTFKQRPARKRYAVLGEMCELGDTAEAEHMALAQYLEELELDGWIVLGSFGKLMVIGRSGIAVESTEEAAALIQNWVSVGDSVLLKGSRSTHVEQVMDFFKKD
jgi:UDP-N-acetylmuramoyl-tripeptide--D-alanyl-D-alanine ligase